MSNVMNSKLILAKNIKMDRDYNNVLNLSEANMINLLESNKVVDMLTDLSYINKRNKNTINVPVDYGTCLKANYIGFQNPNYSNKWFFAWIDEVKFLGENSTEIKFTIDNFSTWFSKVTPKACYVEREHVNDDTIGANIVDENLDVGDVISDYETQTELNKLIYIVIESSWDPFNNNLGSYAKILNNGLIANNLFVFPINLSDPGGIDIPIDLSNPTSVRNNSALFWHSIINFFWALETRQKEVSEVKNVYVVPQTTFSAVSLKSTTIDNTTIWYGIPNDDAFGVSLQSININKVTSFSGLNIKNNKCYCYPYNYLLVTNNNGNQNIYQYEKFLNQNNATFNLYFSNQIGGSGRLVPYDYKCKLGAEPYDNIDESLPLGKYPTFNWSGDAFTNWLTQNGINVATSIFNTVANTVTGVGTVAGGTVPTTLSEVGNHIQGFIQAKMLPAIQGGQNTADVMYSALKNEFVFKRMRCDNEHIKIIDDYFSRFGYKILEVKVPNINGRSNFNYVKISSSEEIGYGDEVPSEAMQDINNAFRKGTTIWHNHSNLGNFAVTNTIVS